MRNYTKIQKILSFTLIFSIFFSFTFNITFLGFIWQIFAQDATKVKVVSIFVQQEIYRQVSSQIKRYAQDIQWVIPDTRTMIIPVSSQEHPYNIASLIEKLYFEWYNGFSGESKLIGTVFVWNIPLPIVENQWSFEKTILPYTDFENKLYVYDEQKQKYQLNADFIWEPKVEIWHGFISPNTGDIGADVEQIKTYFDKNHDFYAGTGNYENIQNSINAVKNQDVGNAYEPYVLYYDQVREFQALNYVSYKAYEQYQINKEDIVYDRYSQELANVLQNTYVQEEASALADMQSIWLDISAQTNHASQVPDILTRYLIQKSIKKFPEIFNTDVLWQFRKDVHNAGRYNTGSTTVRVDLIPQMIANMDVLSQSILKNANYDLEKEIDSIVKNGLARDIAVLTDFHENPESCRGWEYMNFFYGQQAKAITSAQECSIYRWNNTNSGTLVESNRAYNVANIESDLELLWNRNARSENTRWYWWWNSPLNIDTNSLSWGTYSLLFSNPNEAIRPLFDVAWQKKSTDDTKISSPINCFDTQLTLVKKDDRATLWNCREDYIVPAENERSRKWDSRTQNELKNISWNFDQIYDSVCVWKEIILNGTRICWSEGDDVYSFKKIESWIEHKSPTQEELIAQVKSQITPNLAVDKNRYIDFITALWKHAKIEYPFLFRLWEESNIELSRNSIQALLRSELAQVSHVINEIIVQNHPESWTAQERRVYNLLKRGNYPASNVNLWNKLSQKSSQDVDLFWEKKSVNYVDLLALALYWNTLPSVSAKYKFVYEYQFWDQTLRSDLWGIFLPKNRALYEMSYMVAPWNAQNMFIKMDPEEKADNPYADILAKNLEANAYLQLSNKTDGETAEKPFRCSPPDGVPLQDWLPAIQCWIDDMLPPKIEFSSGSCWVNDVFDFEDSLFFDRYDGQGMLPFLRSEFAGWSVKVATDSPTCSYNTTRNITLSTHDDQGEILGFDNYSQARVRVQKIETAKDTTQPISERNKQVVFESSSGDFDQKEIEKYITLASGPIRLRNGQAKISYSTKNLDADVTLEIEIFLLDHAWDLLLEKTEVIPLKIRWETLTSTITQLYDGKLSPWTQNVRADNVTNVFVTSLSHFQSAQTNLNTLNAPSSASEKLFISLTNQSKDGTFFPLEWPITFEVLYNGTPVIETRNFSQTSSMLPLPAFSQAWEYVLRFRDWVWRTWERVFHVLPAETQKLEVHLWTNLQEKGWVMTTHMVSLLDEYGNLTSWRNETVEIFLDGESVTFEDGTKSKKYQIYEGFKKFTLKSTQKSWQTQIKFTLYKPDTANISYSKTLYVVDQIDFDIQIWENPWKVWGNEYEYTLQIRAENEQTNFQSRAYLVADDLYVSHAQPYVNIQNNTASGKIRTKNKATEKLMLQWYIEGVKKPVVKELEILHDAPVRLNIVTDRTRLEANATDSTQMKVQLQDRFWNTTFWENQVFVWVELDGKYSSLLRFDTHQKQVQKWEALFRISSTPVPWTAFFKVSAPELEQNNIFIDEQETISSIFENVWKIDTYYFWNKQKIQETYHNSLYATLLWGNYGDITQRDSLANALIFEPTSKTLSATSLLSDLKKYNEVLKVAPNGNVSLDLRSADISQDISQNVVIESDGNMYLNFFNNTFSQVIAQIFFNLPSNILVKNCTTVDISTCFDAKKTTLSLYTNTSEYIYSWNEQRWIFLEDLSWKEVFSITRDGKISKANYVELSLNSNHTWYLALDVKINGKTIGLLAIHFPNGQTSFLRDLANKETIKNAQSDGGMIVYVESSDYSGKVTFLWSSSQQKTWISLVYNDPFSSDSQQYSHFLNHFDFWYEYALKEKSRGWEGSNKTLLSFAAGKSVGEATKDYASFSLINIWDPVISLKPIKQKLPNTSMERKFDATIWKALSLDQENLTFTTFDYNNDGVQDIAILKRNGFVELLEGLWSPWDFEKKWSLLHMADASSKPILESWDFTGDGYQDLVMLNKNGEVVLFNNTQKDFVRVDLHESLGLKGKIMQIFSFDMDNDGKHDLVIYDDSWEIHIFYGTSQVGIFQKKLVNDGMWAQLSSDLRNDGWAVYFAGLFQLSDNTSTSWIAQTGDDFMQQIQQNITRVKNQDPSRVTTSSLNESLIDTMMFVKIPYTHPLENEMQETISNKTFLHSPYTESEWMRIEKTFTDVNAGVLQAWDEVLLEVRIENTTWVKRQFAYVEKIPEIFELDLQKSVSLTVWWETIDWENVLLKPSPIPEYSFLIDEYKQNETLKTFTLTPWQEIVLQVPLKTRPFQSGFIEVWIFDEKDTYGDISFKMKKESCKEPYRMFTSTDARSYIEDIKSPQCEVPAAANGMSKEDMERLLEMAANPNASNTAALQAFSQEQLEKLLKDSDGDGIPDNEDWSPNFNDNEDFLSNLDKLNDTVDDIVGWMQALIDGFSCGFWGGSCLSLPMNWAPLAPWNDPTLFWVPVGDGLNIDEWIPIFSLFTWMQYGPVCWPSVWPVSPFGPWCWDLWAGWYLGTDSPSNFLRIFVTPTLTWAMWVAVCFWWPASVAGYGVMPGISPLTPWGNCIVYAEPIIGCKNDGSDGEIYNVGLPTALWNGFGVINGNCWDDLNQISDVAMIPWDLASNYLRYKKWWSKWSLEKDFQEFLGWAYTQRNNTYWQDIFHQPLITAFEGNSGSEFSLTVDLSDGIGADFSDIVQIQMQRVAAFPDFLMEWVRRQIEEIVNKLTAFPSLFVVLPSFDGVFDGFQNFSTRYDEAFQQWEQERIQKEQNIGARIEALEKQKANLNCESESDKINCLYYDIEIANLSREQTFGGNQTMSGIRGVYEFLWNLPIISIVPEQVNVNIPWIDESTLNKALLEWELTREQWRNEWERVKAEWGWNNYNCVGTPSSDDCQVILDMENLLSTLDKNIEILKSYKEFPAELHKLLRAKDLWLEQILCNVEIISEIVWGWIGENGKRFRAWVDLYILVKAILKSWQVFIDIFLDYEAECHQCKNERNDLQYFIWKIISGVIPSMPIVQFPKWPDIYMDLHNIRVGLEVAIPDFHFNLRPIVLPSLPNLYLPDAPYINIEVPKLPLLPEYHIWELPEIPTLPSVELPDLPPPPKLPKLFGSLEWVLKILKLITKAMCILKFSPFVPEWRAWDQIAFMTERSGYLSTDFLDLTLPQFSYPVVDAIKITTWVNLEFETEFLTEVARQITLPLNTFTNNVYHLFNVRIDDFDLTNIPSQVDFEIQSDGEIDSSISLNHSAKEISLLDFAVSLASGIPQIWDYLNTQWSTEISLDEFKKDIISELGNAELSKDMTGQKLTQIWTQALEYSFEKEDALIQELQDSHTQKFQALETILKHEIEKNKQDQKNLLETLKQLSQENILVYAQKSDYDAYNKIFEPFTTQALASTLGMTQKDPDVEYIQQSAKNIQSQITQGFEKFEQELSSTQKQVHTTLSKQNTSLLAMNIPSNNNVVVWPNNQSQPFSLPSSESCNLSDGPSYTYKWIYIVEKFLGKNVSYRLFDMVDELKWDERVQEVNDDLVYMVGNEIFFKKNLVSDSKTPRYYTNPALERSFIGLGYMTENRFLSAVNNFTESLAESGYINMKFQSSTRHDVNNYRVEFYNIVDKFTHVMQQKPAWYIPQKTQKHIIDAFTNIDTITQTMESSQNAPYVMRQNLAVLESLDNNFVGMEMYTRELIPLLPNSQQTVVNRSTSVYSGNSSMRITYYPYTERTQSQKTIASITLPKYSNIQFNEDVVIENISWWDAYVTSAHFVTLRWVEIRGYIGKPLFAWTKISYLSNEQSARLTASKWVKIMYYDGSVFHQDFQETQSYEIVDLWQKNQSYSLRVSSENDYFYAKIQAFSRNKFSSYSQQILLSPQKQSDTTAPEILWLAQLRVPVYQKQRIDITDFIYENSGISHIQDIYIDTDLTVDSSWDGNPANDKDVSLWDGEPIKILKTARNIYLEIGVYEEIFTKKIRLFLVDSNKNVGFKDIELQIYAPTPNIIWVEGLSHVVWRIDERLEKEPVSMYRMRWGNLSRLFTKEWESTTPTTSDGWFWFVTGGNKEWLKVQFAEKEIATINEQTGKISLAPLTRTNIEIEPSSWANVYPQILIKQNGEIVYKQHIVVPPVWQVEKVQHFQEVLEWKYQAKPWVYFLQTESSYEAYVLPGGIKNNSGDMVIYAANERTTPIFTIYKDGRIETMHEFLSLAYEEFGDYVVFRLLDRWREVWKVMLIPEWNFVIQ